MNILFLLSQIEVTGAETYVQALANNFAAQGHNVFIASDTFSKEVNAEIFKVNLHQRDFTTRRDNIEKVRELIRNNKIDIVHANSRASSWVGNYACKKEKVPMVVTVHGLSGVRLSKKLVPALGDKTIAIADYLKEVTIKDYSVNEKDIKLIRNGLDFSECITKSKGKPIEMFKNGNDFLLTYIGRATGPKKDIVFSLVKNIIPSAKKEIKNLKFLLLCTSIPEEILSEVKNQNNKQNENYILIDEHKNDVFVSLKQSDLVIAAGRSAIESVILDKPLLFWGESLYGGLLTQKNIITALASNFGDCFKVKKVEPAQVSKEIVSVIDGNVKADTQIKLKIENAFNSDVNSGKVFSLYKEIILERNKTVLQKPLPILLYHRVTETKVEGTQVGIYITKQKFEEQLQHLQNYDFKTITFFDIKNALEGTKLLSEKNIILTFDDGYEDNYTIAFPLMKRYGATAVIYLVTGIKSNLWDKKKDEPDAQLMNKQQIKEMYDYGVEFGAHTLSHANLTEVTKEKILKEIYNSKIYIEKELKLPVISFAYPYGESNEMVKSAVKSLGFTFGVATDSGPLIILEDLFQIRRQIIFPHTSFFQFKKKISKWYPAYKKFKSKKK